MIQWEPGPPAWWPRRRTTGPKLQHLIFDLSADWVQLRTTLPQPVSTDTGRRTGGLREFGHPAEWASDQAARVVDVLWALHDMVADYRGETRPAPMVVGGRRQRREGAVVSAAVAFLEPRTHWLCSTGRWVPPDEVPSPWARFWQWRVDDEALRELHDLHHQIRRGLGHGRHRYLLPMPCPAPSCGLLTLERIPGMYGAGDFVVCGVCDYRISDREYPFLCKLLVETLTADQLAKL